MKLNPPDSSSDLETARAIARRLHQRVRGADAFPESTPIVITAPPQVAPTPSPPPPAAPPRLEVPTPEPAQPSPARMTAIESTSEPEPPELPATELELEGPELEPEPPALESETPELEAPELEAPELEPEASELGGLEMAKAGEDETAVESEAPSPLDSEPPSDPVFGPDEEPLEPGPPPAAPYGSDTGEYESEPPPAEPELEPMPPGGFEAGFLESDEGPLIGDDDALSGLTEPPDGFAAEAPPDLSPEDLLEDEPAPPPATPDWSDPSALEAEMLGGDDEAPEASPAVSWDEVADSCLALTPARGAMLVDPGGQVLTSRGDWPEPGPEAIAGRLVSMMEKKLRDAPTRSVSAPLAGQHLTAWRVAGESGYLTVVFMADAPLKADVRPAIDTAIQAAGS